MCPILGGRVSSLLKLIEDRIHVNIMAVLREQDGTASIEEIEEAAKQAIEWVKAEVETATQPPRKPTHRQHGNRRPSFQPHGQNDSATAAAPRDAQLRQTGEDRPVWDPTAKKAERIKRAEASAEASRRLTGEMLQKKTAPKPKKAEAAEGGKKANNGKRSGGKRGNAHASA